MRLFLDTNIFPEFIDRRAQYNEVCLLIDAIHDGHFDAYVSTGCMYTLAFLFGRSLKRLDVHRPELTKRLRGYLAEVLDMNADQSHIEILTPSAFVEKYINVEP